MKRVAIALPLTCATLTGDAVYIDQSTKILESLIESGDYYNYLLFQMRQRQYLKGIIEC